MSELFSGWYWRRDQATHDRGGKGADRTWRVCQIVRADAWPFDLWVRMAGVHWDIALNSLPPSEWVRIAEPGTDEVTP